MSSPLTADVVPTQPPPYRPIYDYAGDEVENLEAYQPGGYYPVDIGDAVRDGRYEIVHKLGFGTYSTVWLAQDTRARRLVALKFLRADADPARYTAESRILRLLRSHPCVLELLDEFDVDSANGTHHCLVTEPLGPSVSDVRYQSSENRLPSSITRAVAAQCISGVAYLHSRGVVHGGTTPHILPVLYNLSTDIELDLHIGNILFSLPGLADWSIPQVYEHFGTPRSDPITRIDGLPGAPSAPRFAVRPPNPTTLVALAKGRVCIVDFGEAFTPGPTRLERCLQTAVSVAAPEILFDSREEAGMPADVWALGCAVYEVLGDSKLFVSFMVNRDEIIADIVSMLGRMPARWWGLWEARERFSTTGTGKGVRERVQELGDLEDVEKEALVRMLAGMVKWESRERVTAAEVKEMVPVCWGAEV